MTQTAQKLHLYITVTKQSGNSTELFCTAFIQVIPYFINFRQGQELVEVQNEK